MPAAFHPMLPEQGDENLWSYDGTFPPKLMSERYGEPMLFRQYNGLPIDPTVNGGFGLHTLTTHEHNGHHPAESDGGPAAYFFPVSITIIDGPMFWRVMTLLTPRPLIPGPVCLVVQEKW